MAQILETVMLVCFGLSWPVSVVKNVRARTAKGMSLPFILMITFGYVAGITAKLLSHNINYVLIVYFINIVAVGVNIAVYFRNRRLDRLRENGAAKEKAVLKPALAKVSGKWIFFSSDTFTRWRRACT